MTWQERLDRVKTVAKEGSKELQDALTALEQELTKNEELTYEAPFYWKRSGEKLEGPYCQVCWDTNQKFIHLQRERAEDWVCKVCGNTFGDDKSSPFRYNPPF